MHWAAMTTPSIQYNTIQLIKNKIIKQKKKNDNHADCVKLCTISHGIKNHVWKYEQLTNKNLKLQYIVLLHMIQLLNF